MFSGFKSAVAVNVLKLSALRMAWLEMRAKQSLWELALKKINADMVPFYFSNVMDTP